MQKETNKIPAIFDGQEFLDPKYGPAFRALLDDEETLTDFLNSILRLEKDDRIKTLTYEFEKPIEISLPNTIKYIFDIHAQTFDGRFINIELQRAPHSFFIDRAILYNSILVATSKSDLEKNRKKILSIDSTDEYSLNKLQKLYELPETISIWLCNFHTNLYKSKDKYRDSWRLYSENSIIDNNPKPISTKNVYIIIDLLKFAECCKEPTNREQIWLSMLTRLSNGFEPELCDSVLSRALDRIRVNKAGHELIAEQANKMDTEDDYRLWVMESHAKGLAEGRAEGRAEERFQIAKTMLADKMPLEKITAYSGLTKEEILALQ